MATKKSKRVTLAARAAALGMMSLAIYSMYTDTYGARRHGGYAGEWQGWKIGPELSGRSGRVRITAPDGQSLLGTYEKGHILFPAKKMNVPQEVEIIALDVMRRWTTAHP